MKTPSMLVLGALLAISGHAFAQGLQVPNPPRPPQPRIAAPPQAAEPAPRITQNYLLTITIEDKDAEVVEVTMLLASSEFMTSFVDAKQNTVNFQGLVTPKEDGALMLRYTLSTEIPVPVGQGAIQYRSQSTQASVLLKPGDNVVAIKGTARTVKLALASAEEKKGE